MSWAAILLMVKSAVLAAAGYLLVAVLIGVNCGVKYWKEAEIELSDIPPKTRMLGSASQSVAGGMSIAVAGAYLVFAVWWLGLVSWEPAP